MRPVKLINLVIGKMGFELRRNRKYRNPSGANWGDSAHQSLRGMHFGTIIDIGAAHGTPWLYDLDESAKRVLIEPVQEFNKDLEAWKRPGDAIVNVAIGEDERIMPIYVDVDRPMRSSLHQRDVSGAVATQQVPVTTLDGATRGLEMKPPFLVKVDVEGHELQAIRGCEALLPDIDAVIVEVSQDWGYKHVANLKTISMILGNHSLWLDRVLAASVHRDRRSDGNTINVKKTDLLFTRGD